MIEEHKHNTEECGTVDVHDDPIVRMRLLTRNARLIDVRKKMGLTQAQLASYTDVSVHTISQIENLNKIPTAYEAEELAAFLGKDVDYLFPDILNLSIDIGLFIRRKREIEFGIPGLARLAGNFGNRMLEVGCTYSIESLVDNNALTEQIGKVLDKLKPIEKAVIEYRFGLKGDGQHTLKETGELFGFCAARAGQIEASALRKLRHPTRARYLRDFKK